MWVSEIRGNSSTYLELLLVVWMMIMQHEDLQEVSLDMKDEVSCCQAHRDMIIANNAIFRAITQILLLASRTKSNQGAKRYKSMIMKEGS